jgi:membrane-anchored protein YejM (alkaline phosphatase superfamily)
VALQLEAVAPDRMVIVQVESLDLDAIAPDTTPTLFRLWSGATHGLVDSLRTSVSGSSSADFQLLTGLRPMSAVPLYRLAWDRDSSGLPAYAADHGFAFHAYHGNDSNFWNRGPFFTAMGVTFHALESIPATEFSRWGRADGDLFRYAASQIETSGHAVHFLITLSTHAPYDMVDPAAHLAGGTPRARYLLSMAYVDQALGRFLATLPKQGTTLVALYGDHSSNLFKAPGAEAEASVPMILGWLDADGTLAPLTWHGQPVGELPDVYQLPALHHYLEACLDAPTH